MDRFIIESLTLDIYSQDAFARKEIYDIRAPSVFSRRNAGATIVNKTAGTS